MLVLSILENLSPAFPLFITIVTVRFDEVKPRITDSASLSASVAI
jgi:hypothetical protein